MWTPYFTNGSSIILNLENSKLSAVIAGPNIIRYTNAYGIFGGYFSPFFFFWGTISATTSLYNGSAAKYAIYLLLGERPEINLIPFRWGNLDSATWPPLSWL